MESPTPAAPFISQWSHFPPETPLLVLDLDGTVRHGPKEAGGRYCNGPQDVVVFPEALERLYAWRKAGGRILGVTNQGGIALGHVQRHLVIEAIEETQRQCMSLFDLIVFCPHHPDAAGPCECRKPASGMVRRGLWELERQHFEIYPAHLAVFVGDQPSDQQCASSLGIPYLDAEAWRALI